jgi:hypothetical protein
MAERIGPKVRTRNVDPVVAYERAVKAGRSRTGIDYHIRKLAESANALNAEQAEQLRALLPSDAA